MCKVLRARSALAVGTVSTKNMSCSVPVNTWRQTEPPLPNGFLQECRRRAVYPGGKQN